MMHKALIMTLLGLLLAPMQSFAHDEGHGPKLADVGLFGGIVAAVVDNAEASKGAKATLLYKAELVRSDAGTARVYLYSKTMKPLKLTEFGASAKGVVIVVGADGKDQTTPFTLTRKGRDYVGTAPKASQKPFNIDVRIPAQGKTLLVAFDNLD
jgi:hypothetical protein